MRRFLKNNFKVLIAIIITAIVSSSITGVIAYNISARDITYTPSDKNINIDNVESAINDLYTNSRKINDNLFKTALYASSQGDRSGKRSVSLQLSKGKYIVNVMKGTNWANSAESWPNLKTSEFNLGANYESLNCSNESNCTIKLLGKYWNRVRPSAMYSGAYQHYTALSHIYYIEVKTTAEDVSSYINEEASTIAGNSVTIMAIPIK